MSTISFNSILELSDLIVTEFQLKYGEYLKAEGRWGELLSNEVVTNTLGADIPFVDKWFNLSEYEVNEAMAYKTIVGEKVHVDIKKFGKNLEISKFVWKDPVSQSVLRQQLDALVGEVARLKTRQIMSSLALGDTSAVVAYDGQNLFSSSHSLNGATFDNLLSGSLDLSGFNTALTKLRSIPLCDDGSYLPMDSAKFYLVVPPALEKDARLVVRSTTVYESNKFADNPFNGAAEIIVSGLLTDANDWYLVATLPGLSPFVTVRNVESNGALIPRVAETDVNVIERNMYLWSCQVIQKTVPVHYYQMVKVVNS